MSYDLFKDYIPAISNTKLDLMDTDDEHWEKKYPAFMVNKTFSHFQNTILYSQEMNKNHHLDNKLQFDYLLNTIRPMKRFSKWPKKTTHIDLEYVKEYYGYSDTRAEEALGLLNDEQLKIIKQTLNKGG
jgi:hypothetical protein